MEVEPVDDLQKGKWLYEPKYDGFRCPAFRSGEKVDLQSKKQIAQSVLSGGGVRSGHTEGREHFVLDGELIIPGQSFETLQLRLHPAASRIAELSGEFPARLVVFDLLADGKKTSWIDRPFSARRSALKAFVEAAGPQPDNCPVESNPLGCHCARMALAVRTGRDRRKAAQSALPSWRAHDAQVRGVARSRCRSRLSDFTPCRQTLTATNKKLAATDKKLGAPWCRGA